MVRLLEHTGRSAPRLIVVAVLTTALAACGGGTTADADADGIPDAEDTDADGDGIEDILDPFVDLDGDGIDDVIALQDLDGDGIANKDDSDADGDGLADLSPEDTFVDLDSDGFDDTSGLTEGLSISNEITAAQPCGGETGQDAFSLNTDWGDNCQIRRSLVGGQFADSLYAAGVQRVIYCSGFGDASSYTAFAEGEYGPGSEAAMREFQASQPNPIADDGLVGPQTWGKLQDAIFLLQPGQVSTTVFDANGTPLVSPDVYGFPAENERCGGIAMFYLENTFDSDTQSIIPGGWRLARNRPNEDESVPFSIEAPFGRL